MRESVTRCEKTHSQTVTIFDVEITGRDAKP